MIYIRILYRLTLYAHFVSHLQKQYYNEWKYSMKLSNKSDKHEAISRSNIITGRLFEHV